MTDYTKLKNAELENLLKERSLPHTGKKADMVARLTEDDKKKTTTAPAAEASTTDASASSRTAAPAEDEIDWDDDAEPTTKPEDATTEPAAAAMAAGGQGQPPNPQAVPNQAADLDPSTTDDLTVKATDEAPKTSEEAATDAVEALKEEKPKVDYTAGLAATSLDEEIEKRKARAKKFGMDPEQDEGIKLLERQKKFGATEAPKGLDEALPERRAPRKRGREQRDEGRGGAQKRPNGRRQPPRRAGGNNGGNGGDRKPANNEREKKASGDGGSWMTEADRKKADERKARFAAK